MNNKQRKFNYVDILLVCVVAAILALFVGIFFNGNSMIDFSQKEIITITLKVSDISNKHSGNIKTGDEIYFSDSEAMFGNVKYVNYDSETVEFLDKLTNTSTTYKSPDKDTALLLVEATADSIDGVYSISGIEIYKGNSISVFVPEYSFDATIINIETNKE